MATPTPTPTATSNELKGHMHSNALQVKAHVKAGSSGLGENHNATLVQTPRPAPGLRVQTHVKSGASGEGLSENHNATLVRVQKPTPGLKVKTHVKAGGLDTTWKVMSQISDTLKNSCFEIKGLRKQH
jgi:hypothetical protein